MKKCSFVLSLTGRTCDDPVWSEGQKYCVRHDIWVQIVEVPKPYTEGDEALQLADAGMDLKFFARSHLEIVPDEGIQQMLAARYNIQGDAGFIEWIRQVVAVTSPAKNTKPL